MHEKLLKTSCFLFFGSLALFLINIQFPKTVNFDEFHYIPSAKEFLIKKIERNWEHPPLGKILIATGLALFGDKPIGWRFMSTIFGSITLVGVYLLGWIFFKRLEIALWIAILTFFNQLLYVQARIGMIDTFMMGFLIWAMVGFCASMQINISTKKTQIFLMFSGCMFGLSIACKWFAITTWISCTGLVLLISIMRFWKIHFENPKETDWYHPSFWKTITFKQWFISLGLFPVCFYFLTFVPFFWISNRLSSFLDLFFVQIMMYRSQLNVVHSHPYMSKWWEWPFLIRPIWYAFDIEGGAKKEVRGILLLGNPLVMWCGLYALLFCFWKWIKFKEKKDFLILFFYFSFLGAWIFIPRKIYFYYYYYPAGIMLSFALASVFQNFFFFKKNIKKNMLPWVFLGISFSFFIYFLPILGGIKIPMESFRHLMWFRNWI